MIATLETIYRSSFVIAVLLMCPGEMQSCCHEWRAHFIATDSKGSQFSLTYGNDPDATDGFDLGLGEVPIPPPPPPDILEMRFLDQPGRPRVPGDGSYVDIRPFRSAAQVDTFFVRFQVSADAFPVTFGWDGIADCDSMFVEIRNDEDLTRVNMAAQTSLSLEENRQESKLMIIKYGARRIGK